jgi:phosphoribosylglycinamide formyltransferase-1
MKKLAIMGSGNGSNFEAISKFFEGKNVKITCICDKNDAFMLKRAQNLNIENIFLPAEKSYEFFTNNKFDLVALAGYMRIIPDNELDIMGNVINIHPSLLPAFKGSTNAIKDAFLAGVKVSGVTIHQVTSDVDGGKIIAQYPVFLHNDMHFDEFEQEIHETEHKLYPIVIEKILEDKVFDFTDLMKGSSGCRGSCGGASKDGGHTCGGCGH